MEKSVEIYFSKTGQVVTSTGQILDPPEKLSTSGYVTVEPNGFGYEITVSEEALADGGWDMCVFRVANEIARVVGGAK